jgi:hypothetical protein
MAEPLPFSQAAVADSPNESAVRRADVQRDKQASAPSGDIGSGRAATAPFSDASAPAEVCKCGRPQNPEKQDRCTAGHPWRGFPGPAFKDGHRSKVPPAEVLEAHEALVEDFTGAYGHEPNGIESGALLAIAQAQYVLRLVSSNLAVDQLSTNADRASKLIGTIGRLYDLLGLGERERQRPPSPFEHLTDQEFGQELRRVLPPRALLGPLRLGLAAVVVRKVLDAKRADGRARADRSVPAAVQPAAVQRARRRTDVG